MVHRARILNPRNTIVTRKIILPALLAACFIGQSCEKPAPPSDLIDNEMDISSSDGRSIWGLEVDGMADRGYFFPEESAVYWAASLPKLKGQAAHYEIRGEYPVARFMSFQGYSQTGTPLDGIYDFQIEPDPGSANPFRIHCSREMVNTYRITVMPAGSGDDGGIDMENILRLPGGGGGSNYTVVYRVYWDSLPQGSRVPRRYDRRQWEKQGQRRLPRIFYVVDDVSKPHYSSVRELYEDINANPPIRIAAGLIDSLASMIAPRLDSIDHGIFRLAHNPSQWFIGGDILKGYAPLFENYSSIRDFLSSMDSLGLDLFPNNATCYYASYLNPNYGDINLTTFRAPTFPNTGAGEEINAKKEQVRFWSVCIHDPLLLYTAACKQDADLEIGRDGYVTVVFSKKNMRPLDPATGRPVKNWLPIPSPTSLVFIRHMLPSPWFTRSAYYYRQGTIDPTQLNDYDAISDWSGEYYPVSVYCSRESFEKGTCEDR